MARAPADRTARPDEIDPDNPTDTRRLNVARAVAFSTLPVSVAEMMSPPFLPKDTKLTNNQLKLWKFFNNRAMKKVRKRLGA